MVKKFESFKGGRNDQNILTSVEFLPSRTKKNKLGEKKNKEFSEKYPPLPYEMEGLSATEIKNVIYLIGTTRWQQESKVLSFELNGKAWKPETNLKRSRHSPIGNFLKNHVFYKNGIQQSPSVTKYGSLVAVVAFYQALNVSISIQAFQKLMKSEQL